MLIRIALLVLLSAALPARAILVDSDDQARFQRAPDDDPGWANVGFRAGTSAIYLGDGWVLTASHAGFGPVDFDGTVYEPVPSSRIQLTAPDDSEHKADLILFRLDPAPDLPRLELTDTGPREGTAVILVGFGSGRGAPVARGTLSGFRIDGQKKRRWGTNRMDPGREKVPGPNKSTTQTFGMSFLRGGSDHESQATVGDSGGAVFVKEPNGWHLAGVMLSVQNFPGQAPVEVLFGNATFAADLSLYAPQIERILEAN
ncbi:MAG: trypsin-like peptidase domain-containing protein [Myxococcota bacterium]|jgi:hypothetical protein|nr:hypothetical protein [Deltaproteobacteria bacterium]MCP4241880.1 trypsin-like peptidase domain-containing protein [bacterium]MDP6074545.1 trypsin-like peptidase domain-containing protein [Myxococcota bacterium]MDP6241943.1 trypsin-like peptidase domain-containing protein [Myxococcota bacterium]MDP7076112.1 trypsin-like peptidase domain-containing protein [Myxococcota bacterium]